MQSYRHAITNKRILTCAMIAALSAPSAKAAVGIYDWTGTFTIINPSNVTLVNSDFATNSTKGNQTEITGTFTYRTGSDDTVNGGAGSGELTISPFNFFGSGPAIAHDITFTAIGDGGGGAGNLLSGTMLFDWNNNNNIFVEIIWDAGGFLSSDMGITGGIGSNVIAGPSKIAPFYEPRCVDQAFNFCTIALDDPTSGATGWPDPSTGLIIPEAPAAFGGTFVTGGPILISTIDGNPFAIESVDPDGAGPLPAVNRHTDGLSGIAMDNGPFPGFNANFDIRTMTYVSDGSGPAFTQPADVNFTAPEQATPVNINVDLGTVTDEPAGTTVEYSTDGKPINDPTKTWIVDNDGANTITVNATQTVTNLMVDWRATSPGTAQTFLNQSVTVTITDTVAPVIDSTNAPVININVMSTADSICFGGISAIDAIEPNLTIEWSHDGFNWVAANPDTGNLSDNCSTGFGPDTNTMNWRATDVAGNSATYQQTVILNLPIGITGKACTVDLATAGARLLEGLFTMRTSGGAITGTIDTGVTGNIDTTVFCTDPDIANCNPMPPAVTLNSGQPFFGFDWTAAPVRLFDQGTWTFEACPFPRTGIDVGLPTEDWVSPDGSNKCPDEFSPNPITMTVGPGQLGAHMLFDWSVNRAIDVVLVWDVDCNKFELTTTDPDGDGILSTPMVDGPFKGFNAAFDVSTIAGEPPIADGGYTTTILVAENPVDGESPLPVMPLALPVFTTDPDAIRSCVGDCIKFSTTALLNGMDAGGAYEYVQVVHPLTEATPFWSQYRLYNELTNSWGPFIIDSRNDVKTAPLDPVANECPEPGNGDYDRPFSGALPDKLREGDMCLQVTIENNGPNDFNPDPAIVDDPGGVAELPAGVLPDPSTGGGCSISATKTGPGKAGSWWLLAGLISLLGWHRRRA